MAFAHDQLLDDQQSGHVEADSPHFLSIAPGIFKSAKFGIVRKLCQAGVGECAMRVSERVSNLTPSCIFFPLISCQTLLQQQEQQQEQQQQEEQLLPDRNVIKFVNFRNEGRQDLLASDGSCICLARHDSAFTCAFNNPFPALCDFPLSSFASVVQLKHHYTARPEIKKHCVTGHKNYNDNYVKCCYFSSVSWDRTVPGAQQSFP